MSNKRVIILLSFLVASVIMYSCRQKEYGGEDIINYPNLENLFAELVDMESPINYLHVHQDGEFKDSSDIPFSKVPWLEITTLIADANLQKESLNNKYSISILSDSMANTRTLYYEALDPDVPTRTLSIISSLADDKVQNIYFDYIEKGFLKSKNARVLLIPEKLIQIQNRDKEQTVVDSYYYP